MRAVKEEFPNPVLVSGRDDYIESCFLIRHLLKVK